MKTERRTRQEKIDRQLARAGWAVGSRRLIEELLVRPLGGVRDLDGVLSYKNEFVDYVLLDRLGRPLAIIEAKRSSRNPLEGERQASDYAVELLQTDRRSKRVCASSSAGVGRLEDGRASVKAPCGCSVG